jgi:predicted DCC family thiol-disulfide oxidoreductase YuxK
LSIEQASATVYYDGSCPLCRAEIGHYRAQEGASGIHFFDVSSPDVQPAPDLDRTRAMARFHVRRVDGQLLSGAAAFVTIWSLLPRWRWAARIAALPGMVLILEAGYRLSLSLRPALARRLLSRKPR